MVCIEEFFAQLWDSPKAFYIINIPVGNHMFKLTIETLEQGVKFAQS